MNSRDLEFDFPTVEVVYSFCQSWVNVKSIWVPNLLLDISKLFSLAQFLLR